MPPIAADLFYFDLKSLPKDFDEKTYRGAVEAELRNNLGLSARNPNYRVIVGAVIGMLLLEERYVPSQAGFTTAIQDAWKELYKKTTPYMGKSPDDDKPNTDLFAKVIEEILKLPGRDAAATTGYREFAFVGREAVAGAKRVPLGHPNFATQVRVAIDKFVGGEPVIGSLELPPLSGEDGSEVEIEPDNVKAVAMFYAAYQLELSRMLDVVDRITELWANGLMQVGAGGDGERIDRFFWDSEDRLSKVARYSYYSRILGIPGGDVSREVQPNNQFNDLFLRFLSAVSEYDRQQRMADLFEQNRGLALTGEHVRKAGRDLAANASLYGWASAHFGARRLQRHLEEGLEILNLPSVQQNFGVNNPWQVVERVAALEFGQAPNIVRYKTMAEAGNKILNLIAKYATAWTSTSGKPLFDEVNRRGRTTRGDIGDPDDRVFMTQTQYWLAVNGIKDDQIDQLSQPVETPIAPSIPTSRQQPGMNGNLDQIRQMVQQGQMPSMDQLQGLLNANGSGTAI